MDKFIGIDFKSSVLKIDSNKQVAVIDTSNETVNTVDDSNLVFVDLPGADSMTSVDTAKYNKSVEIYWNNGHPEVRTYDESFLYFRWYDDGIYLSMNINWLSELGGYSEDNLALSYHEKTGLFHPFRTLVKEIKCTGLNTISTLDFNSRSVQTTLAKDYINSFKANVRLSDEEYVRLLVDWCKKETNKYNIVISKQSGMDSALVTGAIEAGVENEQTKKISLHLNKDHWLGDYQRNIATKIADHFSSWEQKIIADKKNEDSEIYLGGQLKWIVPQNLLETKWNLDLQLDDHINTISGDEPTLVLQGDRTSLYQHFNSTLAYKVSIFSEWVGMKRRAAFGKWGLRTVYLFSGLFSKSVKERLINTSLVFLAPSVTSKYTNKIPRLSLLRDRDNEQPAHYELVNYIAEQYLSERGENDIDAAEFHSVVRDILFYSVITRNANMPTNDSVRLSLLGPRSINKYVALPSQSFAELFSPKLNIRNRVKALGCDIDEIVASVPVKRSLKKEFWIKHFKDVKNIMIHIVKSPLKSLYQKFK